MADNIFKRERELLNVVVFGGDSEGASVEWTGLRWMRSLGKHRALT
jgi:hypothetical protein